MRKKQRDPRKEDVCQICNINDAEMNYCPSTGLCDSGDLKDNKRICNACFVTLK